MTSPASRPRRSSLALDYVVVKVPRFAFEKFPAADPTLTTTMKSVGEAMAIGRNYATALQKALRSVEKRGSSFHWGEQTASVDELLEAMRIPTDGRIVQVQQALRLGATAEQVFDATKIDPWFIDQIVLINEVADAVAGADELDERALRLAKEHGFSDVQIAQLRGLTEVEVRDSRHALSLRPVYKTVDTCAGEFPALTPYHYSSYDFETEITPSDRKKVVIIGSGPNRIGQGVEFDYSCVQASFALSGAGYETVMVNCNPETVSTDYDTSDRLYFEPLTLEDVLEVLHAESRSGEIYGVVCQLGGQTPLALAKGIEDAGVPDPRHQPRGDRHGGGPSAVRRDPRARRPRRPPQRHGRGRGARGRDRGADRLSGARAPVVRARRSRYGDRLRHAQPARLLRPHRRERDHRRGRAAAGGPLPRRRGGDRRGRPVRRRGALRRRRDGAPRGGRNPLRRLELRSAADVAGAQRDRPRARSDARHRGRRRRARPAECAVRDQRRAFST